ncbi:hypothetical protein AGDE_15123 [Angomonas deanei]|uniref:Uncharacterized protein n=1 Tax=Angomonas deanei TaxID=59799 RepID=A0A7G2CJQ1_9TRYP|nr:hypothetical protein AGDE_15123 [Angomonas deanei]CAD2219619.1 hypothetical protein, conserved [Angomonas deanei]|eukprot:EPY19659.1 hypothetical protein AGDE_15123 [Angomonas deanei]
MERLSQSLPYSIHSRLSNEYFDPSIAIVAPFVGCGMYASREKEFFVPLIERVKRLQATYSFSSSEEILICIAQLSSFLSNMISSFTLSALLFTVERIRHVRLYMKLRRLHKVDPSEPYLKDANGAEISGRGFKDLAKTVCKLYTAHTQRYLERLRRLFPNVFLLGSFANQDESDDELDKPSVLGTLVSILAKLIFLFAGGIGSITADDRRGPRGGSAEGCFQRQRLATRRRELAADR